MGCLSSQSTRPDLAKAKTDGKKKRTKGRKKELPFFIIFVLFVCYKMNEEALDLINLVNQSIGILKEMMAPEGFNVGINIGKVQSLFDCRRLTGNARR